MSPVSFSPGMGAVNSRRIDIVTGVTYTSRGYIHSLLAAVDANDLRAKVAALAIEWLATDAIPKHFTSAC